MQWTRTACTLRQLVGHDSGEDLLEYGLLMLLIAVVAISGVTALGEFINTALWEPIAPFDF